jgi:mono/diheme cytochrome c family protein
LNGAKDITVSQLTLQDRVTLIKTGKNLMAPYGSILTTEQIEAVAHYSMALK